METRLIITAALSGGAVTKNNNPAVPYLPEEFAEECEKCVAEGVSIVHIHAKDPESGFGTMDVQRHREIMEAVQQRCPELIINISTGSMTDSAEARIAPIVELKPEMASFNTNSMNFAIADHKTGQVFFEFIYQNTFEMMNDFAEKMKAANTKPEFEIFDPGGLYNVLLLNKKAGLFKEPLHFQFVYGVAGGMTFDPLLHMSLVKQLPENVTYSVCGVGPNQAEAAIQASITGGHIRIGLEDTTKMPNGEPARGSWEQAKWVSELAIIARRPVATIEETRKILGLNNRH